MMKKIMLCIGLISGLVCCAPSDKIEGVYDGKFYENGDSVVGSVKIIPSDMNTIGVLFASPYGNLSGNGVDVVETGGGYHLYKNGYTPYSNIILFISGSITGGDIQFDYTSSNSTHGSFKGKR